jgi:hypothetical protein
MSVIHDTPNNADFKVWSGKSGVMFILNIKKFLRLVLALISQCGHGLIKVGKG